MRRALLRSRLTEINNAPLPTPLPVRLDAVPLRDQLTWFRLWNLDVEAVVFAPGVALPGPGGVIKVDGQRYEVVHRRPDRGPRWPATAFLRPLPGP